jgi:uncharacterized membrane protein YphA (DoxX/SURF4 family)
MVQNQYYIYKKRLNLARLSLRIGLATVFGFAAFEALSAPDVFLTYIPDFITQLIETEKFLPIFGAAEIVLALWLLSGFKTRYAAVVSFFLMAAIVGFNTDYFNILFRNIAIGFAALALALLEEVNTIFIN